MNNKDDYRVYYYNAFRLTIRFLYEIVTLASRHFASSICHVGTIVQLTFLYKNKRCNRNIDCVHRLKTFRTFPGRFSRIGRAGRPFCEPISRTLWGNATPVRDHRINSCRRPAWIVSETGSLNSLFIAPATVTVTSVTHAKMAASHLAVSAKRQRAKLHTRRNKARPVPATIDALLTFRRNTVSFRCRRFVNVLGFTLVF